MLPNETHVVTIDDKLYVKAIYKGVNDGMHEWEFDVVDEGDTIAYIIEYRTETHDPTQAVKQLMEDTGPVNNYTPKIVWHLLC